MKKKSFPLSKVYRLIETGPVVLVTTAYKKHANIMPISWHTMLEFEPSQVGCVIHDGSYSFKLLKKAKECVINIPTVDLARKVIACGSVRGEKIDKFKTCGLTPERAKVVRPPLIRECYANLECKVINQTLVPVYNFFILKVVKAWVRPMRGTPQTIHHRGRGTFSVAGRTITLPARVK